MEGIEDYLPLISVVIPVYNVEKYIQAAIDSILCQNLKQIEIILVDDGSTDESFQLCQRAAEQDNRIILIPMEHKGVSAARNQGMAVASGKYILFMDADDWMEPDMLEYLYELAEWEHADIAVCEFVKEYQGGKRIRCGSRRTYTIRGFRVIDEINYNRDFSPFLFNKLFLKETVRSVTFPVGVTIGEDYGFLMQVLLKDPLVVRGGEAKYHYRQRADSVSYSGFRGRLTVEKNRTHYQTVYRTLSNYAEKLRKGALSYYVLQEMAVVISMVKSRTYDRVVIRNVQKVIRSNLWEYLLIRRVPFYLKGCAVLLSINEQLLLIPYRRVFDGIRRVK